MLMDIPEIKQALRDKGLKATPQRIVVYESMKRLGHASVDMVKDDLKDAQPALTVATIYNVLELFARCGLVERRFSCNNKMYFDVNTRDHLHIYCTDDNTFVDIEDPKLLSAIYRQLKKKDLGNYTVSGIDLQIIATRTDN